MKLFSFFLFLALLGLCLAAPTEEVAAVVGDELQESLGTDLTENTDHEVMDTAERLEDMTEIDSAERLEDVDEVQDKEDVSLELSDKGYCKYFYYYCYRIKCKKFKKKFGYYYGYKPKKKCYKKFFVRKYKPRCAYKYKCYCIKKCKY